MGFTLSFVLSAKLYYDNAVQSRISLVGQSASLTKGQTGVNFPYE